MSQKVNRWQLLIKFNCDNKNTREILGATVALTTSGLASSVASTQWAKQGWAKQGCIKHAVPSRYNTKQNAVRGNQPTTIKRSIHRDVAVKNVAML